MATKHLHDLFSAAYDGALDVNDAQRFRAHLDGCAECAAAYDQFRTSIDAVRAMPPARMPLPVHLPTDAPVAEQTLRSRLPRVPRLRLVPGAATAVAAVAAAVIVVVALNNHGGSNALSTGGSRGGSAALNAPATVASCPTTLASPVAAATVAAYQHVVRASASGRPGQELVLATQGATAAPGSQVLVYAELIVPGATAAAPGSTANSTSTGAVAVPSTTAHAAVVPCLRVSSSPTKEVFAPLQRATYLPAAPGAAQQPASGALSTGATTSAPVQAFTVPPGTPPGTVIDVTAVIPANYPAPGDPPFTLGLQITVR